VACYSSTNLAQWTFRNQVLKTRTLENFGRGWVLERPKVFYNAKTKKFVMYMHIDGPLPGEPLTVTVPADSSVPAPSAFLDGNAQSSVVAVSNDGPFTAVMTAASKTGPGYAVAAGVPIPPQWVPKA
jgi:hypothetical protein